MNLFRSLKFIFQMMELFSVQFVKYRRHLKIKDEERGIHSAKQD